MGKRLVIIGANDFQNQLILKAKEMGYETHVFAWKCGDVGEKTADFFYPISIVEKEQILEECRKIKPEGITSIASDLASITVNYVAENLGLVGNGINSSLKSTNKYLMRKAFQEHGIPSPNFLRVSNVGEIKENDLKYPVIVKPTDRSGSRGIFKVTNKEEMARAVGRALENSFEKKVLLEEFAEGIEYSVEYVSYRGIHQFLAITRKFTTGAPNFIETGHVQPVDIEKETVERVKNLIERALDSLEIKNGASHSEIKIATDGSIKVIEIGGRMGGDCIGSDLVKLSTGYDFVRMVIEVACGKNIQLKKISRPQNAFIRFIFTKNDLELLNNIELKYRGLIYRKHIEGIPEWGSIVQDSSTRFGYYIITTEDRELLDKIIAYTMQ